MQGFQIYQVREGYTITTEDTESNDEGNQEDQYPTRNQYWYLPEPLNRQGQNHEFLTHNQLYVWEDRVSAITISDIYSIKIYLLHFLNENLLLYVMQHPYHITIQEDRDHNQHDRNSDFQKLGQWESARSQNTVGRRHTKDPSCCWTLHMLTKFHSLSSSACQKVDCVSVDRWTNEVSCE